MKRLTTIVLRILLLVSFTQSCHAFEFEGDGSAPIIDQITIKVLSGIEKCLNIEPSELHDVVKEFSTPIGLDNAIKRLSASSQFINALEKEKGSRKLILAAAPSIITTTNENEITVLGFFSVNGKVIKSGAITLQIIQPAWADEKITCGVNIGQLTFSPLHLVE